MMHWQELAQAMPVTHSTFHHNSIQALLSAPNPDDPLAENVAKHWKENEAEAVSVGMIPFCCSLANRWLSCQEFTMSASQESLRNHLYCHTVAKEWTRLYAQA